MYTYIHNINMMIYNIHIIYIYIYNDSDFLFDSNESSLKVIQLNTSQLTTDEF